MDDLPRRERDILTVIYELGEAAAVDVQRAVSGELSNSAVRTLLARLERRGLIRHRINGLTYLYSPVVSDAQAGESALRKILRTFFNDSPTRAATALLGMTDKIDPEDLKELEKLIAAAREIE